MKQKLLHSKPNFGIFLSGFSRLAIRTMATVALLLLCSTIWAQTRLYVDVDAVGSNTGNSWDNAYTSLKDAINAASEGGEIWVAAGTYKPTADNDRTISFNLKSGVAIYGGFAGTETLLEERNMSANETILSGDIGITGDKSDNSYHVIYNEYVQNTTILDGFTITNGYSSDEYGSGIYNRNSYPQLTNLIITGNKSRDGGGIYNYFSSPELVNCLIVNNSADGGGGGLCNENSSPVLTNCTIFGNSAMGGAGGGIKSSSSNPILYNTIVWGNVANSNGQQFSSSYSTVTLNNSCYGNKAGDVYGTLTTNANCITTDPLFINPNNDFHLAANSPCLDAGDDTYNNQPIDIRGAGFGRKLLKTDANSAGTIDIGAYEFKKGTDTETAELLRLYVNAYVSGGTGDGSSWANAYTSLQQAITDAGVCYEIWVAAGTYKPTTDNDRTISFNLKSGVAIYGGFAGIETSIDERNVSSNATILSGDIGTIGDESDNSYHVVYNNKVLNTAILDGFIVVNGNGDNSNDGGGIFNLYSSPQLRNLIITGNKSNFGGGICNYSSSPAITNCVIIKNEVLRNGGGIYNSSSSPSITNCTIASNEAKNYCGGIYNDYSSPNLNNTIVWGNTSVYSGQQIYVLGGTTNLNNSCYANEANDVNGTLTTNANCITTNPQFVNPNNDFRLAANSPCLDAGDDTYNDQPIDIRGADFSRKLLKTDASSTGTIDMGAYEFKKGTDPETPDVLRLYVNANVSGGTGDGSSWANAYTSLRQAITDAERHYEIWVAAGTYKPTTNTDCSISFNLKNDVAIYGGFAGTEALLEERNMSANVTILSGDIRSTGHNQSYHVIFNENVLSTAILDGFTITNGKSVYTGSNFSDQFGGGIYNSNSSPQLRNLIITGNSSQYGGGIYNTNSSPILVNCLIVSNTTNGSGGGINNNGYSSPVLTNCTVTYNSANNGGGVTNENNSKPIFNNTIVWGNTASSGQQINTDVISTTTLNNSCYSNEANDVYGTLTTNANCITVNPKFVNRTNDFRLAANSPCIDAGDDNCNEQAIDIRGAGFGRKLLKTDANSAGTIDMGAYEFKNGTDPEAPDLFRLYVNANVSGGTGDGSSWANAYTSLKDAINAAYEDYEIWVAAGTYYPTNETGRGISFNLKNGVAIYGGFTGTETSIDERNVSSNVTILSGDIGTSNDDTDNSYFVVYNNNVSNTAILDGFTITNGYSSDQYGGGIYNSNSSPQLSNLIITGNYSLYGGGIYNNGSSPTISNCTISNNEASRGGGIYNTNSSPILVNCLIVNNTASSGTGGGFYNTSSSPTLTNCTVAANSAIAGGGVYNEANSNSILYNTILWYNRASNSGQQIYISEATATLNNSCYGNETNDVYGTLTTNANCLTNEPLFINPNNDFRLAANSPCLDAGDNTYNSQPTDIRGTGFDRKLLKTDANSIGTIDMGAYEFKKGTDTETTELLRLYVNANVSGGTGDGSSWANAYTSLKQAITDAGWYYEIWVAAGTYKPTSDTDRDISFNLKNGVAIYGGFDGTETSFDERNVSSNVTILSGDIGTPNVDTDNSYFVVYNNEVSNTAILDGFTITKGYGEGAKTGGGMYNYNSSPQLSNLIITGNYSAANGGGMYNHWMSQPTMNNCTISENKAKVDGGGIYNSVSSNLTMNNCTIANNESLDVDDGDGGGVYNVDSSPTLNNCIIENNTTKKMGGGICNSTTSSSPTFNNCIISGNTAGFSGGGMFNNSSSPVLFNCLIISNVSEGSGGGLCNFDAGSTLTNCTILGNSAQNGGGVYNEVDSHTTLNNTIVWGNTAITAGQQLNNNSGTIALNNSCYGNETNDVSGTLTTNDNCITSDPEFVDVAGSDFRIQGISPCKNNGDNSYNSTASDIRGQERIQNTTIDMGAYEWTSGLDPEPFISIAATTQANEDATNGLFTISVDKALKIDLTVNLTLSGTATDSIDMLTMAKSVVIPAGSLSVTTPVELISDEIAEGNETVTLTLGTNSGVPVGAVISNSSTNNEATVIITDNDTSVEVSIAATAQAEEDVANGLFTISVNKMLSTDLTVNLTPSGTAIGGVDVDTMAANVLIPAGIFSVTTPVNVISDNLVESNKTVSYVLGENSGAPIGVSVSNSLTAYQDIVTITDDDYATLRVTKKEDAYENISDGAFLIVTDNQFDSDVDVTISVSGTAIGGVDYESIAEQLVFPANTDSITVMVAQLDDTDSEFNEFVTLNLVSTNNDRVTVALTPDSSATLTIFDDEIIQLIVEDPVLTLSKVYDGNDTAAVIPGLLTNLIPGDDVILEATATYNDSEAGAGKTITVAYSISGADASGYHAPVNFTTNVGEITPATLTVTAHNQTKVYGQSNPVLTFEYDGFVNNDDSTYLDAKPIASTSINEFSNVGSYPNSIILSGGEDNNYVYSLVNGDFEISKAPLTVIAVNDTIVYGEPIPELNVSYSGFANSDNAGVLNVEPVALLAAGDGINAGDYTISLSATSSDDYEITYQPGVFVVEKATLTVTADNKSKVYGTNNPELTFSYSGWVNGEESIDVAPIISTTIDELSSVGTYADSIILSGGSDNNYYLSFVEGDFEITQATLTVTAHNQSKVYGDFNPALTFEYSGFVNGDVATDLEEEPVADTDIYEYSNAGSYPSAITFTGGLDNNYEFDFVDGDFEITPATLTVTADNQTKVYGESNPELTFSYSGWMNNDYENDLDEEPTISTTIDELSGVGTYADSIILGGGSDNNYTFDFVPGDFEITPAMLTVTADNKSKVYGTNNPELTFSYSGWVNGEESIDVAPIISTTIDELSSVGTYADSIIFSGGSDNNYSFNFVPGTIEITQATLTVTAHNQSKVYGESNPALTFEYSGFVNGDVATDLEEQPSVETNIDTDSNVGSYLSAITFWGGWDNNYEMDFVAGDFEITPATLTVTADNKSKVYGDSNPELTISYSGWVNGEESIDVTPIISTTIDELSGVGTYADSIILGGGSDNNYTFDFVPGAIEITPATLTVTADNKSKVYGDSNPELTFSYSGWVNGEESIDVAPIISTTIDELSGVGTYANSIILSGGSDNNYTFDFVPGTIEITPATLTVTADNKSKVYGDINPELTFSYSGWMNNDDENDLDEEPTISTTINELSGVGTYADSIIFSGGSDNNYTFDFVPGDFEITPATLTVTADNKSKVYGDSNPELTFSYSGWKNGEESIDVAPIISTTIDELSGVGTYADSIILGGGSDNNYTFDFVPGAIEITPATLTVTADNKSKVYGDSNPELTFSYSGWVNGEESIDVTPIISTTIDELSGVGTYADSIILSGGSDNNYTFDFVPGAIEITPATLTVTADNKSKVYGDINPELTFSYSGWMNNDDENDLDEEPTISTTINKLSSVGTYADSIIFSGGSDNNYSFNFVPGTIEITPATLTVTAHNQTKVYGQDNPELTFVYSGWKNGEESIDVAPIISTTIDELSSVGTYADSIILSGGSDNNYTFDFVPGAIEITPATLTVTADNKSKVYGQGNPELTISYAGFMNGDDTSNLTTLPTINLDGDGVNVGEYDILVAGAQSENYEFKYTNGTLNVEKAQLIVSADNKSAYYNQPIPELTITYSGFQYGEDVSNLTTVPTASTAAVQGSPEGDYNIDVSGGVADNYSFNYVEGVLTISPKQMPVLSWSAPADITYGTPLGFAQLNAVAIVGTDTIDGTFDYTPDLGTVLHTGNSQALHVAFTPDNDALYESVSGDNTINVTKAPLTVIAVNDTIVYGEPIPELNVSYSGFVNGDDAGDLNVEPVASLATGDGINAGDYTISLSATSSDDYEITYQTGVFVVEKATLTVTAHNQTKVYGQSNPVLTFEYDGFVNYDGIADLDEEPTISTTINELSNAGLYPDSITLTGGSDNNYKFDFVSGDFEITKAPLTVTAHNQTKVYGQSNPVLTFEYDGFVNNDGIADLDEEPTISTTINALSNAGLYADSIILSGGAAENYAFNLVSGNFEITKAQLTVKADKKIRTYGCNNPELTYTCSGWVNGVETLDVEPNIRTSITAADRVDLYFRAITLSGGSDNNYDLKLIPGDFKIVKADLYVTANDESKVYGQPNPNLGFTYKGFVNNDNIDSIDVLPLLSTRVADSTDAGFYANAIKLSGGQDNNYKFKFNPGDFEVSKSTLTVTAHNQIRAFGESNPEFTFDVEGFVNNDSISEIDTMPVAGTVADENSPLGEYAIELSGGTDNNYTFEYIDGVLSINGKALPVISWDKPAPIVYGTTLGIAQLNATANAAGTFSYSPAEGAVLEAGPAQQLSVVFTPSDTVNYQPAQRSVSLDVNPAMLTVRADSCKVFQGSPIPGLGCRVDGFVHGENIEVLSVMPQVSTTASSSSQPGVYPITASGAQAQNYEFTYVEAALEIIERHTPEVEWETPAAIVYGTALNSSQLNAVADVAGTYVYSPSEGSILEAGQAQELSLLFIPDDTVSYTRVEKTVSLEVQPAVLNVSANDASVVYGQELPVFDYSISGFVNGETASNLLALPEAVSEEDNRPEAGTYPIVARGGSSNNYVFEYHNGTLSVGKATVRVIVRDTTMKRGEALPEFSVDYEGLVYGQSSANLEQQAAVSTTATADSPVGEYELVPGGAADSNYQFEYVNGTLTIEAGTSFAEIALMDARVYPNPFVGELTIQVNPGIEAEYTLSTLSGQTIVVGAIQQAITPVDLPVLRGGVYLLQLRYNGSTRTFRVLKK